MDPNDQNNQTARPVESSTLTTARQSTSKKTIVFAVTAGVVFAVLIGVIIFLLLRLQASNSDSADSSKHDSGISASISGNDKVLTTVDTADPNIAMELLVPKKSGNTLVFNYRLVNKADKQVMLHPQDIGIYVSGYTNGNGEHMPEPYATSSDGQKYSLVKDDKGVPLATDRYPLALYKKGDKTSGYFTLTLPPSGSTLSVYPGRMSAINGITIND